MSPSLATQCVHTGTIKDERFPGMNTPVYTFTTCEYGTSRDNFYPHYFNIPNHRGVMEKMCTLEGGQDGMDGYDATSFAGAVRAQTKMIFIETPSNPLLKIVASRV